MDFALLLNGITLNDPINGYFCVSLSHKKIDVKKLEKAFFPNLSSAYEALRRMGHHREVVVIQTCNRLEVYGYSLKPHIAIDAICGVLEMHSGLNVRGVAEAYMGASAVHHLFRVAAGLESMMVGEDQILGQVRRAYEYATQQGMIGPYTRLLFERAVHVGKRVRSETEINKGAVGIPSAAIELASRLLGGIKGKKALVIGAGEMGSELTKRLAELNVRDVVIANRTVEKAVKLAERFGYQGVGLDKLGDYLTWADAVFVATAAPHHILTGVDVYRAMEKRDWRKLVIIDISTPSNVAPDVEQIDNVIVKRIDDLRALAEENLRKRMSEIPKAEAIIDEEMELFRKLLKRMIGDTVVGRIMERMEEIRRYEVERALRALNINGAGRDVVEAMSRAILNKGMRPLIVYAKEAAEKGDYQALRVICEAFGLLSPVDKHVCPHHKAEKA